MRPKAYAWALVLVCCTSCGGKELSTNGGSAAAGSGAATTSSSGSSATSGRATSGAADGGATSSGGSDAESNGGSHATSGTSNGGASSPLAGVAGVAGSSGAGGSATTPSLPKRFLLYSFSIGEIDSVPAQLTFLKATLEGWGYEVEASVDPSVINPENLARFGGVGMINTCFEPFGKGSKGEAQAPALEAFVENGGGLFGTHCASVTFQDAEPPNPYNDVIGGRGGHGFFEGPSACRTTEQHSATELLPPTFAYYGNLDNADYLAPDTQVLVKCQWSGGDLKDTAVSWYRTPGNGRVFYTNFAKLVNDLNDPMLGAKHIVRGLGWVLGR